MSTTRGIRTPGWTDDEIGRLLDLSNEPSRMAAEALGRSVRAVRHKRRQLLSGWAPQRSPWSASEDEFLRSVPHFTSEQIAAHLGRTTNAVQIRRAQLAPVGRGRHRTSPFAVEARTLLAKTCPKCGLLLDSSWFGRARHGTTWRTWCVRCRQDPQKAAINAKRWEAKGQRDSRSAERLQAISLPTATRNRQPYLEADHTVLKRASLTPLEKAITLKRTYKATVRQLSVNGYASKTGRGDPADVQWIILLADQQAAP